MQELGNETTSWQNDFSNDMTEIENTVLAATHRMETDSKLGDEIDADMFSRQISQDVVHAIQELAASGKLKTSFGRALAKPLVQQRIAYYTRDFVANRIFEGQYMGNANRGRRHIATEALIKVFHG